MTITNKAMKLAIGVTFVFAAVLSPISANAAGGLLGTATDTDPAHHSTNLSDTDPAHHRPFVVCSASTSDCVVTPVTGFDVYGNPAGTVYVVREDSDPAHHSTNLSDPDPVHHQPTVVDGKLVAIPGFDLNGYKLHEDFFA